MEENNVKHRSRPSCHSSNRLPKNVGAFTSIICRLGRCSERVEHILGKETHIFRSILFLIQRRTIGNSIGNEGRETRSTTLKEMLRGGKFNVMKSLSIKLYNHIILLSSRIAIRLYNYRFWYRYWHIPFHPN